MKFTRDTGVSTSTDTVLQAVLDLDHDLSRAFSGLNATVRNAAFYANSSERGAPNGVCDLGSDFKIPESRLPELDTTKLPAGTTAPVGSIILWPSETPPPGWLECAGNTYAPETLPELFEVLGYTYGGSEEAGYFCLPDTRGMFVRGWNHGAGIDPDASSRDARGDGIYGDNIGTTQEPANLYHNHTVSGTAGMADFGAAWYWPPVVDNPVVVVISEEGGVDGRPDNISLMWIMKVVA